MRTIVVGRLDARFLEWICGRRTLAPESKGCREEGCRSGEATEEVFVKYAITNGSTVLLLVNLDSGSGATIEANAAAKGVKTIDYDRLTRKGSAVYYAMAKDANLSRSTPRSRRQPRPLSHPFLISWAPTA